LEARPWSESINYLHQIKDIRQIGKVLHFIPEIVLLVLLGMMANGQDFEDFEMFGNKYLESLRLFLPYRNGIPSESTIKWVLSSIRPKIMNGLHAELAKHLTTDEGGFIQKLFCGDSLEMDKARKHYSIDGKTIRGNRTPAQAPLHIVTAHNGEGGFCVGQTAVAAKSNEVTAIPVLLNAISCAGSVITIDAGGTQKNIAALIFEKGADYVLALKKNHEKFYSEVEGHFQRAGVLYALKKTQGAYQKTVDVGHGREEIREYFLIDDTNLFGEASKWQDVQCVGAVRSTVITKDKKTVSYRYYITSMAKDIECFSRVVRRHWSVESMYWHLDVTYREDASKVIKKNLAENLNILRKVSLSLLKVMEFSKKLSIAKKRYGLSMDFGSYVEKIQAL